MAMFTMFTVPTSDIGLMLEDDQPHRRDIGSKLPKKGLAPHPRIHGGNRNRLLVEWLYYPPTHRVVCGEALLSQGVEGGG